MLDSDDLAFFTVLASSASLAESARKLNVTPPAVTVTGALSEYMSTAYSSGCAARAKTSPALASV